MREKLNEEFEKIGVFRHINIVLHHLMMNVEHFFRICNLLHLDIQSLKRDYEIESKIIANKLRNWDNKIIVFKHITIFNEK